MRTAVLGGALGALALLAACETLPEPSTAAIEEAAEKPYFYPFVDPYVATVIGTPRIYEAPLPETVPTRKLELTVFEDRVIPKVLWHQDTLKFSLVAQDREAPLIFIIAGTGAAHDSAKAKLMAAAFYQEGYPALMVTDTAPFRYPHYHKATDTPDRVDTERMARIVEAMERVVLDLVNPD